MEVRFILPIAIRLIRNKLDRLTTTVIKWQDQRPDWSWMKKLEMRNKDNDFRPFFQET